MPKRLKTRRPAGAPGPRARQWQADRIDEVAGDFRTIIAAVKMAKQAVRLPWDSPRATRMRAASMGLPEGVAEAWP